VEKVSSWYGDWDTEGNYTKVDVTYWNIIKGDDRVFFTLKEEDVPNSVERYENPPANISSWCD
jgi:hypothetical protein